MIYITEAEKKLVEALSKYLFDKYSDRLKDRDRKIFQLFTEGYKQREIGRIVGCSQAQVSRVKKKFATYMVYE